MPSKDAILFALQEKYNEMGKLISMLEDLMADHTDTSILATCDHCGSQDFQHIGLMGDTENIIICASCGRPWKEQ